MIIKFSCGCTIFITEDRKTAIKTCKKHSFKPYRRDSKLAREVMKEVHDEKLYDRLSKREMPVIMFSRMAG
ncbi:MAG: hypothetical protein ACXQS8_06370 [Candidatus Helarchaeales archaeon]